MADSAKLKKFVQLKIFGNARVVEDEEAIERELASLEEKDLSRPAGGARRPSAYVEVFETMVKTVHDSHEHDLLSDREWIPLKAFENLSYYSRYCLVRLLLLKPNQWYSLTSFEKWKKEVGDEGIIPSMDSLCIPIKELLTPDSTPVKQEPDVVEQPKIIDLTFNSDDEDVKPCIEALNSAQPVAGPSSPQESPPPLDPFERIISSNPNDAGLDYFCEDEGTMTIEELLNRMTVDQLKRLAKENKCAIVSKPKKQDYITSILRNSATQSVLQFTPKTSGKGKALERLHQTQLPFAPKKPVQQTLAFPKAAGNKRSQEDRLRKQAIKVLGKCYRMNYDFFKLIRRLHIIAYRCTEHPPKLMIPALLTTFKKRAYPSYVSRRDAEIWPSRHHILEYEKALELEALVDEILEAEISAGTRAGTVDHRFVTPANTTSGRVSRTTPLRTPQSTSKLEIPDRPKFDGILKKEEDIDGAYLPLEPENQVDCPPESIQVQKARKIVQYLDKWLLYNWNVHLELKHKKSDRPPSLQRFESGYVYTRLLRKSLQSLAALKDYGRELQIIETLLGQTFWQRGKRAKLYERRAVLQTRYLCRKESGGTADHNVLRQALEGVRQALQDDDTHLVARPSLLRRLRRLEKQLKIPPEECAVCQGELRKADEVTITAKRVHHRAASLRLDAAGVPIRDKENTPKVDSYFARLTNRETPLKGSEGQAENRPPIWATTSKRKGKSVWEGRDRQEVNVEERALHFHAETSIMTTIWGLLNWDIIYADVRGAFETPYQSAPLDIVDDSFYHSRKEMFDRRLEGIREGKAAEIITRHDTQYRPQNTWAIGVRWDICELQDLIEIVECLGGTSLASICRLFCEDYVGRSSGAPDLVVWNHDKRICKFVEVKGPGDSPQENQKLWFDSLLGAGIHVEICKVVDVNDVKAGQTSTRKGKSKTPAFTNPRKRKHKMSVAGKGSLSESESEDERDYDQMDHQSEEDELPQAGYANGAKRRRITDPGPLLAVPTSILTRSISTPSRTWSSSHDEGVGASPS